MAILRARGSAARVSAGRAAHQRRDLPHPDPGGRGPAPRGAAGQGGSGHDMIVLALDCSADTVAVAVLRDDEPLAERAWRTPRTPRPTGRGGPQGGRLGVAGA